MKHSVYSWWAGKWSWRFKNSHAGMNHNRKWLTAPPLIGTWWSGLHAFANTVNFIITTCFVWFFLLLLLLFCFHIFLWYCSSIPLSCFISTLLLALFSQHRILASSVFLGWAGGPWGRDPFDTSGLWSRTLPLSVRHSPSLSSFKSKQKTLNLLFCILNCRFLFIVRTHHQ